MVYSEDREAQGSHTLRLSRATPSGQESLVKASLSKRNHRFAVIPEWILYHPELSTTAIRIFGVIDRFVGSNENAWPSHKTIGKTIGVSGDTVKRAVNELMKVGAVLAVRQKRTDGSFTSSEYYVWPKSVEMGATVHYGQGNYALRDSADLHYGGGKNALTRRSINEGETTKEQHITPAPPLASAEVLGFIDLFQSRLNDNGLPNFKVTKAQVNGLQAMIRSNDFEEMTDILEWAMQDSFWLAVILTPLTFKKHYPTLKSRFKNDKLTKLRDWAKNADKDYQW